MSAHVRPISLALSLLLSGLTVSAQTGERPLSSPMKSPAPAASTRANFGHLPLSFEQNMGQTAASVQWLARTPESTLFLSGNDATVELYHIDKVKRDGVELPQARTASLRMSLLNAQPAQASLGEQPQPGKANYFTGNDSSRWQKNVPLYAQVRLKEVYPGISLLYHGEGGQLEYDFVVRPHADPSRISLGFAGSTPSLASNGDLVLPVAGEPDLRFDKPVVYQVNGDVRTPVDASYLIAKDGHVGFQLGDYDHDRELVIDPKLVFLGTIGAGNYPYATNLGQITVDSTGAMYFIGTTNDPTYPVTPGAYKTTCGPATGNNAKNGCVYCGTYGATSAYISKISADGTTLVYSTYLSGGGGYEQGTSIAVDSSGVAYLLGATASTDFPITGNAFQTLCQPTSNAALKTPTSQCNNFANGGGTEYTVNGPVFFYAKLSADGSKLLYSSFLGGSDAAYPVATALDASGNWYLLGQTSVDVPCAIYRGASPPPCTPANNPFNVEFPGLSTSGYFVGPSSAIYADQPSVPSSIAVAAVLSKFSNDGTTLLYGTFFGDNVNGENFSPTSLAVGANGIVFIGGYSNASAITTTAGAVKGSCTVPAQTTFNGNTFVETCTTVDGFVVAFDTTKSGGASLVYSTRIGGSAPAQGNNIPNQEVLGLASDSKNDVYVTGYTYDQTFPVPQNGYLNSCNTFNANNYNNCSAAFALELNPAGTAILGGSFLSGPAAYYESSVGYKVAVDTKSQVYLYGTSQDGYNTFPLVNPVQGYSANSELYIATMSSDLTKLLFSTRIGNPSLQGGNAYAVNGLALDPANNIYFAGSTQDTNFAATPGTYTTTSAQGSENHTFFGKISPVLPAGVTTLSVTPTTTSTGQPVTFNATVATVSGTVAPTGTVTVSYTTASSSTPVQFKTLQLGSSGSATYTTTSLAAGTYTFTGAYSGDSNYDVSTSSPVVVTVNIPVAATVALTASATTVLPGTNVTFTATVAGGKVTPTGTVTFLNGTTVIGSGTLNGSGVATYTTSFPKAGSYLITASYGGDTTYSSATSSSLTEVVQGTASVTLASSAPKASSGYNIIFTASVSGSGASAPTGTVTFLDGTTTLGTGTLTGGTATYSTSAFSTGTHNIIASYAGDGNYSAAVSTALTETIVAPSFTITYNPNPLVIQQGQSGTSTMTITPGAPYSGTLSFGCGGSSLNITCSFNASSLSWSASNNSAAQSSVITVQTTSPHAALRTAASGAGTWLESIAVFFLVFFARSRKGGVVGRRLMLLLLLLVSAGAVVGVSGCSGNTPLVGGTPTGTQSLSITFNGTDNASPLSVTVH